MAGNVFPDKAALRQRVEGLRRALSPEVVARWGGEVQRHLAALPVFGAPRVVALYGAQPFEVPTSALHQALLDQGHRCVYPRVASGTRALVFHYVARPEDLVAGPLGIRQPRLDAARTPLEAIDAFVVPGVAFTRAGARLGRGGGYYDATLAARRPGALVLGVCFECQIVEAVPEAAHDVRVDCLVTEAGVTQPRVAKTQV